MPYERCGECSQCGDCCVDSENLANGGYCEFARQLKDGKWACSDRTPANPYYWNNCRVWPQAPESIVEHSRCTYFFKLVK